MAPPPTRLRPGAGSDYYEVLGLPFDASVEDIRKTYHDIVRTLHPDRRRSSTGTSPEALERFHQVQSAWRCLSDPTRRLLYDLRNFGRSSIGCSSDDEGAAEEMLICRQKEQALLDVRNMQVELERILQKEKAARGLLVRSALYGDLRLREENLYLGLSSERAIAADDLVGPVIDVSEPLQCLVERHSLVLPGGIAASKADLPGFYNPVPLDLGVELSLYVLYEFRGRLHEVIVGDREGLKLPIRQHAVPSGQVPRGPFSPANANLILRRKPASAPRVAHLERNSATVASQPQTSPSAGTKAIPANTAFRHVGPEEALMKAVGSYRVQRLLGEVPRDEVTSRELLAVLLGAGTALTVAWVWNLKKWPCITRT